MQDRSLKLLIDSVGLGRSSLRLRVVDVIQRKIQLIFVMRPIATELCTTVCENPQDGDPLSLIEREHPIIQQIRCNQRRLLGIEITHRMPAVTVDVGLLVDATHSLHVAHIEGVLTAQIPRMLRLDLAVGFLL